MQSPKYSAFSAHNPPHPVGFQQPQPYPGYPPYNNPVTVQNPGTIYVRVQPLPKLILYCPCCKIPWETYRELASHCCGKSFDSFIHCGQPYCIKTFFKEDVNKYLDHVQNDHVQRHEL
uniref:C2H2-type domain-containing protein n=1 Tax=Acrobeloides nanus TaxID=290746 RepID=A0A914CEL9_9BILA